MEAVAVPRSPDTWDALPAAARGLILALQAQVVVLQAEVAALHQQVLVASDDEVSLAAPWAPRPLPTTPLTIRERLRRSSTEKYWSARA